MFNHRLFAWSGQRLCEVTGDHDHIFGSVPVVNVFGDLDQLGPLNAKDLHTEPGKSAASDQFACYSIYRQFEDCVVLNQTMRQGKDEQALLNRLLRIRNGTVNQQDWLDINSRYEENLTDEQKLEFQHEKVITLHETWVEVRKENRSRLSKLGVPVAVIPSTGRGRHHMQGENQVGQIVPKCLLAVGCRVILTKNQGSLTQFGLNNGAMGTVISILYEKDSAPPSMPTSVICEFPAYNGPAWIQTHPTWIPIVPMTTRCEDNCCSRTGLPLMPGYSIPIAKSQGMTVGRNKPATHMRIKLQNDKFMERLSLGTTYTAFSRVETESRWCLVEKIPQERLFYINNHPHMPARKVEEDRLSSLSNQTIAKYNQYLNVKDYVQLLKRFDEQCNDGITVSVCSNKIENCKCILCESM